MMMMMKAVRETAQEALSALFSGEETSKPPPKENQNNIMMTDVYWFMDVCRHTGLFVCGVASAWVDA